MSTDHVTFLIGPTKSGKTTLSHVLNRSKLSIRKSACRFIVQAFENFDNSREIGNEGQSKTLSPSYYLENTICDFPGFNDTRGEDKNIQNLIKMFNEIQKHSKICLGICIEEGFITTSNASLFINFTNDLIDLLNLTEDSVSGIRIIVMKSSMGFSQEITQIFNELFPEENNFIVENIKNQNIEIIAFELPVVNGSEFEFSEKNRNGILEILNKKGNIKSLELQSCILPHIINKLNSLSKDNPNIIFLSSSPVSNMLNSESILCIDRDFDIHDEKLIINAPVIVVSTNLKTKDKRFINITGKDPIVRFISLETMLNGGNLVISTNNIIRNIAFPDPTKKEFNRSTSFFRIESICVNGVWTEYASHNNKFIDLIAYINPEFGRIEVDPKWNVKIVTVDIKLKLFVNECMRTKKGIIKEFKALKAFKSVDDYMIACKKFYSTPEVKSSLELYGVNLPSIFQIMMKPTLLYFFTSKASEIEDLLNVRQILIERYLKILADYINNRNEIRKNEINNQALEEFNKFLERLNSNYSDLNGYIKEIKKEIIRYLNSIPNEENMKDFYSFYNALSVSEDKVELAKYNLTGDISMYPNFQAVLDMHNKYQSLMENSTINFVQLGSGVGIAGIGITIGVIAGRSIATRVGAQAVVRAGLVGASLTGAAIVGTVLVAAQIGINLIVATVKSGYFEKECCYEGRLLRIDCNTFIDR